MRTRVIKTILDNICDFLKAYQEVRYEYYKQTGHKYWY